MIEHTEEYVTEFYKKEDGTEPAKEFIENLSPKMIAKVLRVIELLEKNGPIVRMPYSEHLEDGFVKKANKTPKREIKKAKKFRRDYERRTGYDKF